MGEVECAKGRVQRSESAERALREAEQSWASSFGAGSRRELGEAFACVLASVPCADFCDAATLAALRRGVEFAHRARYGVSALCRELDDERERDAARSSDRALVAYEQKWTRRLIRLARAHPSRWHVPGLSDEEVRAELTLRLIEALRSPPPTWGFRERAGVEWGQLVLAQQRRSLRRSFRLNVVLLEPPQHLAPAASGEERLIEEQSARAFGLARERAEGALSRSQRRWFAAMRLTANAGGFFDASGRLNLAAVSRQLERNRSSAQRAFGELQAHFKRELRKLDR